MIKAYDDGIEFRLLPMDIEELSYSIHCELQTLKNNKAKFTFWLFVTSFATDVKGSSFGKYPLFKSFSVVIFV